MFGRVWRRLKPCFLPASPEKERPWAGGLAGRYVRSFLFVRLLIGFLGIVLPLAVVLIDWGAFSGDPVPRDSLSIYYYSGMREVFTVTIGTIAFFLFAYKITEKNLDNTFSVIAGFAGMLIPLCPTNPPKALQAIYEPTALQDLLSEKWTQRIHFGASGVFIFFLGLVCVLFAHREANREDRTTRRGFWKWWHLGCAGGIALAGVWILITIKLFGHKPLVDGPYWSLLLGEWIAAWAFAFSWFAKGAELNYVLGIDKRPLAPGRPGLGSVRGVELEDASVSEKLDGAT